MTSRFRLIVFAAVFFALWSARELVVAAPAAQRVGDIQLPPITYLCPMNGSLMADGSIHADVYEDAAGTCAICKMTLAAARLESIWTCPVHSVIHQRKAGVCPRTCASNPEIDQITPSKCPETNTSIATNFNQKYVPTGAWLVPTDILPARFIKFSMQADF